MGDARYKWLHGIPFRASYDEMLREERVSITFRAIHTNIPRRQDQAQLRRGKKKLFSPSLTNFPNSRTAEKKMQSSALSPHLRLYKHALESIFSHLTLSELGRISAACRDWSTAVDSMRPIGATVDGKKSSWLLSIQNFRLMRHVSNIHIRTRISASGLAILCYIIKQSKSLCAVSLNDNELDDDDAVALSDTGAIAIAEAIKQSKSLLTVNLSGNYIGDAGVSAIAEAIKQSTLLLTVNLSDNYIGYGGASAIAEAIKQSKSLTSMNLSDNLIRDEGACAISEAIQHSNSMNALDLRLNKIGIVGFSAIAEATKAKHCDILV